MELSGEQKLTIKMIAKMINVPHGREPELIDATLQFYMKNRVPEIVKQIAIEKTEERKRTHGEVYKENAKALIRYRENLAKNVQQPAPQLPQLPQSVPQEQPIEQQQSVPQEQPIEQEEQKIEPPKEIKTEIKPKRNPFLKK